MSNAVSLPAKDSAMISVALSGVTAMPLGKAIPSATRRTEPSGVTSAMNRGHSTMSQIGYMVMGVSIGAYVGGLFHLMTHAFFKALLFMAAGSIIAAMANNQNIDRMSGFRRAMPFTSVLLIVGALALAAFPFTSGFFSKDEILAYAGERGGMYTIFQIGGYIGAFMTAIYAFRIGFRVVAGPPCEEAKELEQGHLVHAEPVNPATGERRTPTSASPVPSTTSPSATCRCGSRWGCSGSARSSPASSRSPA